MSACPANVSDDAAAAADDDGDVDGNVYNYDRRSTEVPGTPNSD